MTKTALCLIALAMLAGAQAAPRPELNVLRATTAPRIDGRLDDACWQGPAPITDFRCVDKERTPATQRTQAWVAYDADALYVAAKCADDHMDQVPATVTELDGPVWRDDCLEVFLMPGTPYVYHFGANLLGARFDARYGGPAAPDVKPPSWNADWRVAAQKAADGWTMEIAIPFACLEWGADRVTAPLGFNLGREQRRLAEFSCWPASEFNKPDEFALLTGVTVDAQRYGLRLSNVPATSVTPGANRFTATVAEGSPAGTVRARVKTLPDGSEQVFSAAMPGAAGGRLQLDYQLPLAGGRVVAVFECLDAAGKARVSRTEQWRVPAPVEAALELPLLYASDGAVCLRGQVALRGECQLQAGLGRAGQAAALTPVALGPEGRFMVRLPVRSLPPGRYTVQTRLTAPGTAAAAVVNEFAFRIIAGPLD